MKKMTILLIMVCAVMVFSTSSFAKNNGEGKRDQKKDGSCYESCMQYSVDGCALESCKSDCDGTGKGKGQGGGNGKGQCKRDGSCRS